MLGSYLSIEIDSFIECSSFFDHTSTVFVTGVVGGLRFCLREQLTKQREAALFFLGIFNKSCRHSCSRRHFESWPANVLLSHYPLGWVSVKLFAAGSGPAALCFFAASVLPILPWECSTNCRRAACTFGCFQPVHCIVHGIFHLQFASLRVDGRAQAAHNGGTR